MTTPLRRRAATPPALQVVERTRHFTVRAGRVYQDTIVRHPDGSLWVHYLPAAVAA